MNLQTERLSLRPLALADAEAVGAMMADPKVMAHWDVPAIDDPALVLAIVAGQLDDVGAGRASYWVIETRADGAFVGCCDLSDIDRWHRRAEIGFMLARAFWGGGFAFEAMAAVVEQAFAGEGLRRLTARVHLGNDRSVRLLTRLGFAEEGVLRGYVAREDERRDCQLFGLLAPTPPRR